MRELKEQEVIEILGNKYIVRKYKERYYLETRGGHKNHEMFVTLNLDRKSISNQVLGYHHGGDFPWCESLSDLTKIVEAIYKFTNKEVEIIYEIY